MLLVLDSELPPAPRALVEVDAKGVPHRLIASEAALIVRDTLRGKYARCPAAATWHRYTGAHWEPLGTAGELHQALTRWLYDACDPLGFTPRYLIDILTLLEKGSMCALPDPAQGVIPFQNGLLDVATRQLLSVTPDDALTWSLPYNYESGADCPTVKAWLSRAVDDDAPTLELLRAWMAALITGRADLQRFLHLPGPGGSGKGTLMRLCRALVGARNAASSNLQALEQNRFETATLYGKRLVLVTDSDKYGGSINVLKALTGQDPLRLERKHVQQAGTFTFDGLVMLASNEPLMTTDLTSGLERRRVTVEFNRVATEEEKQVWRDQGGEEVVLHRELPGVVNWVLGLTPDDVSRIITYPPARTRAANLDALTANNPVAGWLVDCCAPAPGNWVQIGERVELRAWLGRSAFEHENDRLFPSYLAWTKRNGKEALSLRRFKHATCDIARVLGADVLEVRRPAGRGIQGLRLLRPGEPPHPWGPGIDAASDTSSIADAASAAPQAAPMLDVPKMLHFRPNFVCTGPEKNVVESFLLPDFM